MRSLSSSRLAREVHFLSSLALALLLVFFAASGFIAEHRDWFHERVDRAALGDVVPLGGSCGAEALTASASAAGVWANGAAVRVGDGWELSVVRGDEALVLRCAGDRGAWLGRVMPMPSLPEDRGARADALGALLGGGRRDDGRVEGLEGVDGEVLRVSTVWATTTAHLRPEQGVLVAWVKRFPVTHGLIELHRGRGETARLIDVTAWLSVIVALSGIWHGLRYPGRRRRLLVGLVLASALLVGVLLAG